MRGIAVRRLAPRLHQLYHDLIRPFYVCDLRPGAHIRNRHHNAYADTLKVRNIGSDIIGLKTIVFKTQAVDLRDRLLLRLTLTLRRYVQPDRITRVHRDRDRPRHHLA